MSGYDTHATHDTAYTGNRYRRDDFPKGLNSMENREGKFFTATSGKHHQRGWGSCFPSRGCGVHTFWRCTRNGVGTRVSRDQGQRARVGLHTALFLQKQRRKGTKVQGETPGVSKNSNTFYCGASHLRINGNMQSFRGLTHRSRDSKDKSIRRLYLGSNY